ncbi:MAG: hypothetical protein FWD25_01160 [Clostridia bacterium]|nr:hypothetical protein [Clostridia bacterium]
MSGKSLCTLYLTEGFLSHWWLMMHVTDGDVLGDVRRLVGLRVKEVIS